MSENVFLKGFLKKVKESPELLEEFKNAADESAEKAYDFARKNSEGEFTKEEFEDCMKEFAEEWIYAKAQELGEDSLENVSGGDGEAFKITQFEGGRTIDWKKLDKALLESMPGFKEGVDKGEKVLNAEIKRGKKLSNLIGGAETGVKLLNTLANIGFSIYKFGQNRKYKSNEAEKIKLEEYEEMLKIGRLKKELNRMNVAYGDITGED